MLVKMGALLELKADQPKSETLHDLKQLTTARQGLLKDRTAAKALLAATTHGLLIQQIKRRLKQIDRDLSQIAEMIDAIIEADKELRARSDILTSIPGIAKVTAWAILTDLPKLGGPERQASCEAGRPCTSLQTIRKVARQGTHSGRARQCQAQGNRFWPKSLLCCSEVGVGTYHPSPRA